MECLQKGTFWFCGQKPSFEFFCPTKIALCLEKPCHLFREIGCVNPRCLGMDGRQRCKWLKMCITGRPFFVCSERDDPRAFWQWGDVFEGVKRLLTLSNLLH